MSNIALHSGDHESLLYEASTKVDCWIPSNDLQPDPLDLGSTGTSWACSMRSLVVSFGKEKGRMAYLGVALESIEIDSKATLEPT